VLTSIPSEKDFKSASYANGELLGIVLSLNNEFTGADLLTFLAICKRINPQKISCFGSRRDIAAISKLSVRSVQRSINRLVSGGLILRTGGGEGQSCTYHLTAEFLAQTDEFLARRDAFRFREKKTKVVPIQQRNLSQILKNINGH